MAAKQSIDHRRLAQLKLADFITAVSPELAAPRHLAPLLDELDLMLSPHQGQRVFWFSVPPRHYKTTTLRHAALQHVLKWPEEGVAFLSHTQAFANKQSRDIKKAATKLKLKFSQESKRQNEWELAGHSGGVLARGVGGDIMGRGVRLIIVDDPVKSREKANSEIERERLWAWIEEDVLTRLTPDGCLILVHTRWSTGDPIGKAISAGWPGVNLPALSGEEEDQPLLPDVWGYDYLDKIRRTTPWKFASLYQGAPRPREASLFQEATLYTELPKEYRPGYGVDLAYTENTRADYSVLIKGFYQPSTSKLYIVDVKRSQVHAPEFASLLAREYAAQPAPMLWIASGTEKGSAQFIRQRVPKLKVKAASSDKYSRATPVAEAWNEGRVLVPDFDAKNPDGTRKFPGAGWTSEFIREITNFTGHHDAHDDQVDALAALFRIFQASKALLGMKALAAQGI